MSLFVSRAKKKKLQHKKNKYQQMLYELVRLRREEAARVEGERKGRETKIQETTKEDDMVWSAKVGEVRNRLTDRKRASKERWNRFAGTSDAGGRGL